ncbi:MAG TPA: sigma-70 family RNA polymerase sigma factor [Gemmatimonadaceae bacterium]|nr:sigma-70 family RNA polymerase sigma factor [Gemmatimonadaceae bacterium]
MSDETLEKILGDLRPKLHRFCSRMVGSVLDGEDLVQETLTEAFLHVSSLRDATRLEPWLFRIAHHKCVDFIRRARRFVALPPDEADAIAGVTAPDEPIDEPLAMLVGTLPPKERASVLLKDVLDYPLDQVAEIIDSTVGGVKAALHRGRAKLRASNPEAPTIALDDAQRALLDAYVDRFNRQDWDGLRDLIQADARLEIVGAAAGTMLDVGRNYFSNYLALPYEWRLAVSVVDGELVTVHERRVDGHWHAQSAVRLWWQNGKVVRIRDYVHVDYLLTPTV